MGDLVSRNGNGPGHGSMPITERQQEIAILIAAGLTNAEIAKRLTLTPGTVANHVEHILRRLQLRSRTSVAVWAVEQRLYRSEQG